MQKAKPTHFVERVLLQHSAFLLQSKYEQDKDFLDNFSENPTDKERHERDYGSRMVKNERGLPMVMTEEELNYLASIKVRAEEKGKAEGLEQGRDNRNVEIALAMLADNKPIEEIVKYSHLPDSKVLELKKSLANETHK